jgi:ElaB/YqjD/DUF883 family membrane-anchored ribosome-binding protein
MGEDPGQIRQQIEETRAQMGDTVDALAHKADVKGRAKDAISEKKDKAMESITQTKDQAAGVAQQNPIGLAIGGVAVGFLLGIAMPTTQMEDKRLGPVADQAKDKAREAGQEAVERGKTVVHETAQAATEAVQA